MNSIFKILAVTAVRPLKSPRRFRCRSAAATWFVAIFFLVDTSGILFATPVDESKAPYVSPSAVSVVKPDRRSPRTAPDPASRQAIPHRDLRKDAPPADISLFTGFPEPLKPVGDPAKDSTTSVLVTAINRWAVREKSDDFSLLEDFIGKFPSSTLSVAIRSASAHSSRSR